MKCDCCKHDFEVDLNRIFCFKKGYNLCDCCYTDDIRVKCELIKNLKDNIQEMQEGLRIEETKLHNILWEKIHE